MRISNYRTWLLGLSASFLIACGVESPPAPETGTTQSELSAAPAPEVIVPRAFHQPGSSCPTVGASTLCCPLSSCSCPGTQDCQPGNTWGDCEGFGPRGQPCP